MLVLRARLLAMVQLTPALAAGGLARWALRLERGERSYLRRCCELLASATPGNDADGGGKYRC